MIGLDRSTLGAMLQQARNLSLVIGAIMLILTLGVAWLMHHSIAKPIHRIGEVLMRPRERRQERGNSLHDAV